MSAIRSRPNVPARQADRPRLTPRYYNVHVLCDGLALPEKSGSCTWGNSHRIEMRLAARPCPYHRRSCWRASAATPSAVDTILSMPLASKFGQAEKAPSWDPRDLWVVRCRVLTCPENQNAYFITRVTPIELKSSVSMV